MAIERIPRIRLRGVHDDSLFVVRGDELDASMLAEDASRFHERFIEWGRVEIVPTFRRPHVTLCHEQLDELVTRLRRCEHRVLPNPYNVADDGM